MEHDQAHINTTTILEIEGMTCANCANGVRKQLEKKGLKNVDVNFATGEARFDTDENVVFEQISSAISNIGYKVLREKKGDKKQLKGLSKLEKTFILSAILTAPLLFHMFLPNDSFFNNPWFQLALSLPVFIIGITFFGKSALGSLKTGVPNMDVLIMMGSSASFIYSVVGTLMYLGSEQVHQYMFFETAATIITLVMLGNVLEHRSVKQTTTAIKELESIKPSFAKMEVNGEIVKVPYDNIMPFDTVIVNTGDKIPVDGVITSGSASVDESMISGESLPVEKEIDDTVMSGTILISGSIKVKAQKVGSQTTLSQIIEMVKSAQQKKPSIQKLGDKVSAIFVPIVVGISIVTFLLSYFAFDVSVSSSLMRAIAVLVISCPCAMGLATPTAVMAGIGRAAKNGILIKGGSTLEKFANTKNIVFDKTGTLTTGKFKIKNLNIVDSDRQTVVSILVGLEKHSSHPIAESIVTELKNEAEKIELNNVKEEKGIGLTGEFEGDTYKAGSYSIAKKLTDEGNHNIYIIKNDVLIATIDIEDDIKPDAKKVITYFNESNINTSLLSGDKKAKTEAVAKELGIKTVYSEQMPDSKLNIIENLSNKDLTAMVGDGINDALALAQASVGISLSKATQAAIHSAEIVLLKQDTLESLITAKKISNHTLKTIKQNLFWAFAYNIVAIPFAAMGFLSPMIAAFAMAFSDTIVIGNSIRLKSKKLN